MATVKYDVLGAFVGPDFVSGNLSSGDIKQLSRVQSSNYSIEIQRDNVMGLGSAYSNDSNTQPAFVSLSIDYLITNGQNEKNIGFIVDGEHGSFLNMNSGSRDYFLSVSKIAKTPTVLAIGNGMLTKYSVSAQVGSFVRGSIDVRGFNIKLDEGTSGNFLPSVNVSGLPESSYTYQLPPLVQDNQSRGVGQIEDNIYVGPGNLDIKFPNNSAFAMIMSGENKSYMQGFAFNVSLDRNEITKMGNKYPFKRCLTLPTKLTLSANFLLSDFVADNIQNYFCQTDYDIEIAVKHNQCSDLDKFWETETSKDKLKYIFRGMKLENFSSSDSIGDRKAVSVTWSVPIGNLLDINRNLFISGDFGRYLFPLGEVNPVVGEPTITGQNLQPFDIEYTYKRTKFDADYPEFNMKATGNFDISPSYPPYFTFFEGNSGIFDISGKFGSGLSVTQLPWNSDGYDTTVDGLPSSGFIDQYSLIQPPYFVGYTGRFDTKTGIYNFAFKNEGFNTEPVEITIEGLPTWITPIIYSNKFTLNPYKPYYFDYFGMGINDFATPTGTPFQFQMIAKNSKLKKIYKFVGQTPYSFHIGLPHHYVRKTSLWLDPYNETKVSRDANFSVSSIQDSALRGETFLGVSGSGYLPSGVYQGLNGKSYFNFESGASLLSSGTMIQDFRNFSFFSVFKPTSTSESGAALLTFSQSNTGILNDKNYAFFGRKDLSNDLIFYYVNPSGTSGHLAAKTNTLQVTSTFDPVNWNLASIIYDGVVATGRRNGNVVGTQLLNITTTGLFDKVEIGTGNYHGNVAEIILFPYKLTPNEIIQVEDYLRYKWGI